MNKLHKGILCVLFFVLPFWFCGLGWAAPAVSSISGTVTNGSEITISGSGFGSKTTAAPVISSYDNATSVNNWSTGSLGGSWTSSGSNTMATDNVRSANAQNSYNFRYVTDGGYVVSSDGGATIKRNY